MGVSLTFRSSFLGLVLALAVSVPFAAHPALGADRARQGQNYHGQTDPYAAQFGDLLGDLDAFWSAAFRETAADYRSPETVAMDRPVQTGCGPADPSAFAFYCNSDETIYFSVAGFADHERRFGDFAPIVVTAHEWGHHVQWLLRVSQEAGNAYELQADCLAGAYANDASTRGLLDPGDVTEAVLTSADAGDDPLLPQDQPGAHGTNDDRITAFMRGYIDGVAGCELSIMGPRPAAPEAAAATDRGSAGSRLPVPPASVPQPVPLLLPSLIPVTLSLPHEQAFRVEETGERTLSELALGFPDPTEANRLLLDWGWQETAYTYYASDSPPAGAAGWIELSVHRFATVDAAAAALPYFAETRQSATGMHSIDLGLFGDQAMALAGPAYNGDEVTIYARRGRILIRATGIAPNGDPTGDVIEAALIPLRQLIDEPRIVSPDILAALPSADDVPAELRLAEEHARSASSLAAGFADPVEAERLFQMWDWRESAARVFVADGVGSAAGTTRMEAVLYRLGNAEAARAALPYFMDARAVALGLSEVAAPRVGDEARAIEGPTTDGREATIYVQAGAVLLRFTAIGSGNPMADLWAMLG